MMTSSFNISGKSDFAVGIAGQAPDWYTGRQYRRLAPKYDFFIKYKQDGDESYYIKQYQERVLDKLNPETVFKELGQDAVILCWEEPGAFCHRRLVAGWLESHLGITVPEYIKECSVPDTDNKFIDKRGRTWEMFVDDSNYGDTCVRCLDVPQAKDFNSHMNFHFSKNEDAEQFKALIKVSA
jgi:uncharacterized protein (DUF488 family)